ncbi:hypothetical protein HK405_008566 [Cladochytrium tenue]|nr:hypothetical protein HK405_008566 [Cladochytrium tenue]
MPVCWGGQLGEIVGLNLLDALKNLRPQITAAGLLPPPAADGQDGLEAAVERAKREAARLRSVWSWYVACGTRQ